MSLLGLGIAGVGAAVNTIGTLDQNRKSRQFQEKMFHMTNEYNHPLAQRQRLEEAGLNPALMYGGSVTGAAGTADQPAKPDFDFPDVGQQLGTGVGHMIQAQAVQSQLDINRAREDNIEQDTANKGIDAILKAISAQGADLDYKQKKELFDTVIETEKQKLENLGIEGVNKRNRDAREERMVNESINKINEEIQLLRKQGKNVDEDTIYKAAENELWTKYRIGRQDPAYMRIIMEILEGVNIFGSGKRPELSLPKL